MEDLESRLRTEIDLAQRRIEELERRSIRSPVSRYLGRVYNAGALPSASMRYFATHPASVSFAETEGSPVTITTDTTRQVIVGVLGGQSPAVNDLLIAKTVGPRWVSNRPMTSTPCAPIMVRVTGCGGSAVVGATVSVTPTGGGTTVTGTTASDGRVSLAIMAGGSYSISASKATYATGTTTFTATCAGPKTTTIALVAGSGYICVCCPDPLSAGTKTATFAGGQTATLSLLTTTYLGQRVWGGQFSRTVTVYQSSPDCTSMCIFPGSDTRYPAISIPICFDVYWYCNRLAVCWTSCGLGIGGEDRCFPGLACTLDAGELSTSRKNVDVPATDTNPCTSPLLQHFNVVLKGTTTGTTGFAFLDGIATVTD